MRELSLLCRERILGIPVPSQGEELSTGKARETPASCHHSKSPPEVSVHSRGTCFPCTASTFTRRIASNHGVMLDSPVGNPRGKASREIHRSLDPRDWKHDTAATPLEERARACPLREEDLFRWGDSRSSPRTMSALERNPQVPVPHPHKVFGPGIEGRGIQRGPRAIRMWTVLS